MNRRARFTRQQRIVLAILGTAVVAVFGLLGYAVVTTVRRNNPPAAQVSPTRVALSPLTTPTPLSLLPTPIVSGQLTISATVTSRHTPAPRTPSPSPSPTSTSVPVPTPTPTRPAPLSPLESARFVQEVGQIVAGIRDLPPIGQIPVTFPSVHELSVELLQLYQEERPQDVLNQYALLGLVPRLDPLPLPDVGGQADSTSSYYVADGAQISIVTGRGPTTLDDELGLVHALVTALQDAEYDFDTLIPCQQSSDARLALQALVEGDAVLVTALYAELESEGDEVAHVAELVVEAEVPDYAQLADNQAFARLRYFPYLEGAEYVADIFDVGGWRGVDGAYVRPPCSTEQVLHPESYLGREPVQEVTIPDLVPVVGEGWTLQQRDTLGELLLGLHLASHLDDEAAAWDAAAGWAGDTLVLWEHDKEDSQLVVWRIAWDSLDDAREFERAYSLVAPRLMVPSLISTDSLAVLPGRLWEGASGAAYVARAGRVVTVIWGTYAEVVVDVAQFVP